MSGPATVNVQVRRSTGTGRHVFEEVPVEVHGGQIISGPSSYLAVKNETGSELAVNALVYASGWSAASGVPLVTLADADAADRQAMFVVPAAIPSGAIGLVTQIFLSAANLNTNAASAAGDPVYLSTTAGGWTVTAPTGAAEVVQTVGHVVAKSATVGQVAFHVNDLPTVGTNELQAKAVTLAKMADVADGTLLVGNASSRPVAVTPAGDVTVSNAGATVIGVGKVKTAMVDDAQITLAKLENVAGGALLVGDVSNRPAAVVLTGDVTVTNAGVTAIGATKVKTDMVDDAQVTLAKLANVADGALLIGDGTNRPAAVVPAGDVTITNAGVTAIGTNAVTAAQLAAAVRDTFLNGLRSYVADGMLAIGTIVISVTAEAFKTTTTAIYRIGGLHYTKAATDPLVFSGVSTINTAGAAGTAHWGAFLVQINAAGTVSTKPGAYTSGTDQDHADEATAIAALPAVDAANIQLGYITIQGKASTAWIEATSDMTAASDCETSTFYNLPAPATLPAAL